ncbi:hypothetical protein [Sphingomonas sp. S2-65]|uniref:hypothetical protein n=1 Tax=Sphingomonas sp. S2-65 TaxID=2903960 RepID=UPI001F269A4F|nr:hypothetical protein [Sphingomonas sp. S2-65]UYY57042.1 hypothetical protein LZ586_10120 [Sphingomonas sp. S2-65]
MALAAVLRKRIPVAASVVAGLLLAGCDAEVPAGQVLATVDSKALTRRDLQAEQKAAGETGIVDLAGPAGVERLVSRELLVRAAEARSLALTPEYLAAVRRSRDDVLIALLRDQVAADLRTPAPAELNQFIAARPWMFRERAFLTLDGISTNTLPGDQASLQAMPSLNDAALALAASRRPVARWQRRVDTAELPAGDARQLASAGVDAAVVLVGAERTRIVRVLRREPVPITGEQAVAVADAVVRRTKLERALDAVIARERRQATVRYQEGFGPARQ